MILPKKIKLSEAEMAAAQGHGSPYSAKDPRQFIKDPLVLEKLDQWQDLKFGFFVHWAPYSIEGTRPSWPLIETHPRGGDYGRSAFKMWTEHANKDIKKFRTLYWDQNKKFNPVKLNPKEWVKMAKDAGTKYFVYTTKHHDGFSMFDTKLSDFKVTAKSTPFHKHKYANVTKVLFDEFRNEGFKIGAYFSKADWHSDDFWIKDRSVTGRNPNYDVKKDAQRWQRFVNFTQGQIDELMTGYGDIDVLWFDSGWVQKGKGLDLNMDKIAKNARKKQPGLLVVDRTVHGKNENFLTPEQVIPKNHLPFPWETCMTSSKKWSWNYNDKYKTSHIIINQLVHVVAMGGNYLLNAAPDQYGEFDPRAKSLFKEIGQWMAINGDAIFETRPIAPYKQGQWRFTASKDLKRVNALYLIKEGQSCPSKVKLSLSNGNFKEVKLLGYKKPLKFKVLSNGELDISLPAEMQARLKSAFTLSFFYD